MNTSLHHATELTQDDPCKEASFVKRTAGLVTLSTYRRYTDNCIYLSIYITAARAFSQVSQVLVLQTTSGQTNLT